VVSSAVKSENFKLAKYENEKSYMMFKLAFEEYLKIRNNIISIFENYYETENIIFIWSKYKVVIKQGKVLKKSQGGIRDSP
jgi:hypothetical protein